MRLTFCVLCGENDASALEHHHYIPVAQGGTDDENNIFTVCGTCHGRIHHIPRPHRLGELVKEGQQKERDADELREIAARKAAAARNAATKAIAAEAEHQAKIKRWERLAARLMATRLNEAVPAAASSPTPTAISAPAAISGPFSMVEIPMYGHKNLSWHGPNIQLGRRVLAMVVMTDDPPEMYRVYAIRTGRLSDMFNLTRAKDAAAAVALRTLNNTNLSI